MTSPKVFERVYQRYDSDDGEQKSIRVKVKQLANDDWYYEIPGELYHACPSRECTDVDQVAMDLLTI